jgi:uncharacterized protein YndB with AHSA1/START domain
MPREFECSRELVLPASPEQVWEAVATTAGNAAWVFPNEIKPDGSGVTAWDPPTISPSAPSREIGSTPSSS